MRTPYLIVLMFPAACYDQLLASARVGERSLLAVPRNFTELELQARWFAGDFGRSFTGTAGEEIEIVQFGIWNREAGPDFSNAAVRVGGQLAGGNIEFDLTDQNWEVHTATRPIQPSTERCCTFSLHLAPARSSVAQRRTATFRRCALIRRPCLLLFPPIFRWPD